MHRRKHARFHGKTDKKGGTVGRPSCQSSLLRDPNAKFSPEMWRKPQRTRKVRRAATSALTPSSRTPLLGPGPLRTGRETFVLIRLKPFERLSQGDAVSIRIDVGGEPCRGTLDEAEHGCLHS